MLVPTLILVSGLCAPLAATPAVLAAESTSPPLTLGQAGTDVAKYGDPLEKLVQDRASDRDRQADEAPADSSLAVGAAGVAWYTTWESGLAEAKRSGRPIFFMSAATCTRGVSGVF